MPTSVLRSGREKSERPEHAGTVVRDQSSAGLESGLAVVDTGKHWVMGSTED